MAVEKTLPGASAGRTVLVTGGAGYIGSHAVLQLLLAGFRVVVVDNLNNSSELAVRRVAVLAGDHSRNLSFHKVTRPPRWGQGGHYREGTSRCEIAEGERCEIAARERARAGCRVEAC
ncbi:hypothetical protein ZEAMMB73_Zm00001d000433 [Zea mays]|jgi:NAD(P)-dependent dehydrogenase (short-subunit alcohol dehydrogenase family)|nr:hypothetical protein ZEAMMB73_Zm00001d000433 [Zea mays]